MISAFGVEHGEVVSKVKLPISRAPRGPGGKRMTRAQVRASQAHLAKNPTTSQKVAGGLKRIGQADVSLENVGSGLGRGLSGVGSAMRHFPGTTGTLAVTGGTAAGYRYLSQKEPRKKKS